MCISARKIEFSGEDTLAKSAGTVQVAEGRRMVRVAAQGQRRAQNRCQEIKVFGLPKPGQSTQSQE
jgi:hypothetical protein